MTTYYPQTVVYEEKKVTYWVLLFVLLFIGIIFLLLEYTRDSMGNLIFLPLFGLSFGIFATYNMAFYSVKIFDDKTSSNARIWRFRLEDGMVQKW